MRKRPSGKGIKRTPVEENEGERKFIKNQGNCSRGKCTGELACKELDNNYYTCVCPHDSKAPMPDGSCPRYTVPLQPGLIPNVLPPSKIQNNGKKNLTGNVLDDITPSVRHSTQPLNTEINFYIIIGSLLIFFTTIFLFSLILKRKYRLNRNDSTTIASPINLKTSIIPSKRYTPNPQYTACSGTGVPLLKKETLKFLHEIGEGCFGKVYKGEYTSECYNNKMEIVAIKVLKENATKEAEDDFLREVEIMSAFRHPNILSLIGVVTKDTNLNPMMVFEYMSYGDLAELLREQNSKNFNEKNLPPLTNLDILSISLQIAKGMSYLAAQRFVHRDLACRNCLVSEGPVVKIADFGMSRDVYTCDYYKIGGSRLLPVRWMSPESVIYGRFTLESDIWSFGVVLWEIYSFGKQPYYGHTNDEVVKLILTGIMLIPPNDCPTFICELMKNCWKTEPKDRMKFLNIVDKLNKEYENLKIQQINVNIEEEIKPKCFDRIKFNKTLPRPPPMSVIIGDEMDIEGYLLPKEMESVKYLETLPA